jgi:D-glycero-D-manno-heptose 1,7-bisphosphate phosphatase
MKLMVLDRDGVINHDSDEYIKSPAEWEPIPGSIAAISRLTQYGWRVVVATNQSGVARGYFDMATLNAMHNKMHRAVNQAGGRIEAVFYCAEAADSASAYRKPMPGMLLSIAERFNVSLDGVPSVGDSLKDLQAAAAVSAVPVLVLTGKGQRTRAAGDLPQGTQVFADLAAVATAYVT